MDLLGGNKKDNRTPAEQYLQNAFEISIDGNLEKVDEMFRSLWMCILQKSVEKKKADKVDSWKKQLKEIELKPSDRIPLDIYELCDMHKRCIEKKSVHVIRVKTSSIDPGVAFKPNHVVKALRQVMDNLSILCGEVSEATGIKVLLPSNLNTKGV